MATMNVGTPLIPWNFLDGTECPPVNPPSPPSTHMKKSFAQALKNSNDIALSQLPQPCIKGDAIAIKIPEEDYQEGVKRCKTHLHGRLILAKGDAPLKFEEIKAKLSSLWSSIGGIGAPISLDDATNNRAFGHFARVLVDMDLKSELPNQILVEREGYAFFVELEYEKLPQFCTGCQTIGHLHSNCRKKMKEIPASVPLPKKKQMPDKILKKSTDKDFVINLEINHNEEINLQKVTRVEDTPMTHQSDSETMEDIADIEPTVVEDSLAGLEQLAPTELAGIELNEVVECQMVEEMSNPRAANDMRLLGRLWADEDIEEEVDDDSRFTNVISRSQKKKQKKKDKLEKVHNTRRDLVFLAEPMIDKTSIPQWFWTSLNLKLFFENDRGPLIPSIWGLCKMHLAPLIISSSIQQVSMTISIDGKDLFIAAVYGGTTQLLRRILWEELRILILTNQGPWCCVGDFNVVLGNHECRGMRLTPSSPCADFKNFTDSANLIHLQTRGSAFTWSNRRRGNALTEKRLDRSLCNKEWIDFWSQVACCTLPRISSDHHPILLCSDYGQLGVPAQFKFQKMWLHHQDCSRLVEEVWQRSISGCSMSILSQKLKLMKKEFKVWNVEVFGLVSHKVTLALDAVALIQDNIARNGPNDDNLEEDRVAQQTLIQALTIEEEFWKQKSRLNWFTSGDRNTSFFHRVTKIRNSSKSLTMLRSGGSLLTDQSAIETLHCHNDMVSTVVPALINDADNSRISATPSHNEIKAVVFDMNGDGAPRPDGFGGSFYQAFWSIVGPDVCRATLQFFTQDYILPNLNSNNVVLIPKVIGADKMDDFRPIAMANFQFKIISKVLADRLASIAPKIISNQQRGFIKDRQINDCICLASEAINLLDHKIFGGNLAIKIDIKKAFDTLDWDFLLLTLKQFGFNHKFRNWIKIILDSARLSINVNGKMVGFFKCTRGVRQGDPLSPLLFCIAEDVLSRGLSKLLVDGQISTIEGPKGIKTPSHVLYADDIFIFCKGKKRELLKIKQLLNNYSNVSGQCVNAAKSKFYSTNSSQRKIASIAQVLGFSSGSLPLNYLGVPIFLGKPRRIHLQRIADKITNKLATWKGMLLSIMGRIELVRSVIQSMLLYSFKIYAWPTSLLKHIDNCIRNFVWSGNIEDRKLVTVAWKNVCLPFKDGGLGLRSLKKINHAALLKLAWEMISSNHEWAIFFRDRFGSNPTPSNRYFKSSIWSAIKANWHTLHLNSVWIIGNGQKTNFWLDNWLGEPLVDTLNIPLHLHNHLKATVADFISNEAWIIPHTLTSKYPNLTSQICNIIPNSETDKLAWKSSNDGLLSAKDAYLHLNPGSVQHNWGPILWSDAIPPSKSFIAWRLLNNKMPTDDNLKRRGCVMASICSLCNKEEETATHLFFNCPFSVHVWNWLSTTLDTALDTSSLPNLLKLTQRKWSDQVKLAITASIIHAISSIWFCRNQARFNNTIISLSKALSRIKLGISLSGNNSKACASNSISDFALLRLLQVRINYSKAPKIIEVIWLPPAQATVKINTDGAARGSPGPSAGGGIFRNHEGQTLTIVGYSEKRLEVLSSEVMCDVIVAWWLSQVDPFARSSPPGCLGGHAELPA
ncbi:PREDICTED: uncharacterized protein LOC109359906 [Lupinus angustifolius]|uniref:uncharacterized protein LOC109359906 n=1 Tax=Lupinus angustifolius TaxID=3871 RepID=UPI00092E5996|nr:PREDICTED: uncharacterized protein LOC109359906 [Lupinus angustifolius]